MTVPFIQQQDILDRSINEPVWAFFCEPGTGKTLMAIKTAEHWYAKGVNTVVVVCAKTLIHGTWIKVELPKHSSIPYNTIGWKSNFNNGDKDNIVKYINDHTKLLYLIVNPDSVPSERFEKLLNYILSRRKVGWVYDESSAIKDRKTDRFKWASRLSFSAVYKRIMTGTPITEGPLDTFSQTQFLRPYLLGFKSYTGMKTRYCVTRLRKFGNRAFQETIGYRDLDDLRRRLDKFSSFLKLSDIKELPAQTHRRVAVELTDEQIQHYNNLKQVALTIINNQYVDAVNALALLKKLHQILVGQIKLPTGGYASIRNNRLETLADLMDEVNHKVIIWSIYRQSTLDIEEYLGDRAVAIKASHTPEQREEIIKAWRNTPNIQGLVLNQANAAHGLTLNEAKTSIYYSNDFSLEKRLQSMRRNYRIGQEDKTTVIDLFVPGTLEENILYCLDGKLEIANLVADKDKLKNMITSGFAYVNKAGEMVAAEG